MSLQITQWLWRNRVLVIKVSFSLTSVLVTGLMQFGEWCKGASRNSTRIFGRTIGKQTTFLWHTEFSQWPTSACLSEGRHAVSMSIRTEEESHFRQIQFLTYYRLRNKINSNNLFFRTSILYLKWIIYWNLRLFFKLLTWDHMGFKYRLPCWFSKIHNKNKTVPGNWLRKLHTQC